VHVGRLRVRAQFGLRHVPRSQLRDVRQQLRPAGAVRKRRNREMRALDGYLRSRRQHVLHAQSFQRHVYQPVRRDPHGQLRSRCRLLV